MKFNLPNWISYIILPIILILLLRLSGRLIERFDAFFAIFWVSTPIITLLLLLANQHVRFRFSLLRGFKISTLICVGTLTMYFFVNFEEYTDKIDNSIKSRYGEIISYEEYMSPVIDSLPFESEELEDLQDNIRGKENLLIKAHTKSSKNLSKATEIVYFMLIFVIPIVTWRINKIIIAA